MKTVLLSLLLIISSVGLNGQELGTLSKHDCEVMNLTLDRIDSTKSLYDFLLEENLGGVINLHPFTIEDIGGWENFLSNIRVDSNITFAHKLSTPSRLLDGTFHQYKQFYKGIEVIDGGFTILTNNNDIQAVPGPSCPSCPPVEPCSEIQMFSPFIYEDINLSVIPTLSESQLAQTLNVSASEINNIELKVVNNILKNCEYLLVYKTIYKAEEDHIVGWVDAHSGSLLYESHLNDYKFAPTADFGEQFMNDVVVNGTTELTRSGLSCYELSNNFNHACPKRF